MTRARYQRQQPNKQPQVKRTKRSKYGNVRVKYDGHQFDSKAEWRYYMKLKQMKLDGLIKHFEMQERFLLMDGFVKNGRKFQAIHYVADFVVTYPNGEIVVIDVKGQKEVTKEFTLKYKMFHAKYSNRFIIARWDDNSKRFIEKETLR